MFSAYPLNWNLLTFDQKNNDPFEVHYRVQTIKLDGPMFFRRELIHDEIVRNEWLERNIFLENYVN